ncbi:MAG: peroxiredoxin-like family protein [Bacteroidota bacterium]
MRFLPVLLLLAACADPDPLATDATGTDTATPDSAAVSVLPVTADEAAASALSVGDRAPDFALPNASGGTTRLSELLLDGPVVLTFYRGAWCPYCNTQLRDYQQALGRFEEVGAQLVAVSPQRPDSSMTAAERNDLAFPVLSDVGNTVSQDYGLVFRVDDETRQRYAAVGLDLEQYNGSEGAAGGWALPVPATYVIDRSGTVRAAFVEADYTRRASTRDLFDALNALT